MRRILLCITVLICAITSGASAVVAADDEKEQALSFLRTLYHDRNQLILNGNPDTIAQYYNKADKLSRLAMRQEMRRSQYLQAWAEKRDMRLTEAEGDIRVTRFKLEGDKARVSLIQSVKIAYQYNQEHHLPTQSFGVGTRHALTLRKLDNRWYVVKEWYLDPMDENPNLIPADSVKGFPKKTLTVQASAMMQSDAQSARPRRYNREKAVAYANKYAGAAWGAGNKGRYNPKYRDYTYVGGDCTNFASQVIGDPEEGGGLPMTGDWQYWYRSGGSHTWVQTDRLKNFLLYSGYGRLIAKGTFTQVVQPSDKHPQGAVAKLEPGDLIAYEMNGDVDHFSVVVGHDVNGYPLVNSHTADRYKMPFDLGWDKSTKYLLIHIND